MFLWISREPADTSSSSLSRFRFKIRRPTGDVNSIASVYTDLNEIETQDVSTNTRRKYDIADTMYEMQLKMWQK